jgi:hypothetical protein
MNLSALLGVDAKLLESLQVALPLFTKAFIEHTEAMREHTKALNRLHDLSEEG